MLSVTEVTRYVVHCSLSTALSYGIQVVVVHLAEVGKLFGRRFPLVEQKLDLRLEQRLLAHVGEAARVLDGFLAVEAVSIRADCGN